MVHWEGSRWSPRGTRLGDGRTAALQVPAQDRLRSGLPVRLANRVDRLVRQQLVRHLALVAALSPQRLERSSTVRGGCAEEAVRRGGRAQPRVGYRPVG